MTERIRLACEAAGTVEGVWRRMWNVAEGRGRTGPSRRTLNRWLSGHAPSSDHLALFCVATGVSADYILGLTDDPTPATYRHGGFRVV
jgi:hypothetical protein